MASQVQYPRFSSPLMLKLLVFLVLWPALFLRVFDIYVATSGRKLLQWIIRWSGVSLFLGVR